MWEGSARSGLGLRVDGVMGGDGGTWLGLRVNGARRGGESSRGKDEWREGAKRPTERDRKSGWGEGREEGAKHPHR